MTTTTLNETHNTREPGRGLNATRTGHRNTGTTRRGNRVEGGDDGYGPLNRIKERRLLYRYHHGKDLTARAELVDRFLPLARRMARRFENSGEPLDDLIQVASLGLLKAIDGFDSTRQTSFSSYAVPTMLGELKRYFRDKSWSVHVPRGLRDRAVQVQKARTVLCTDGHTPSINDLAEMTGLTVEQVREAVAAADAHDAMSLDATRATDDAKTASIADSLGDTDPGYETAEFEADLAFPLAMLPDDDRKILTLRFQHDLTQAEIATKMGVSQMQVSRHLRIALERTQVLATL